MWQYSRQLWSESRSAKSLQSCPTLCDPRDGSPPGSPIPGILQARTLEWVSTSFSNAWKWKVKVKSLSNVWLLATPWTAAHQAPPSMGFSRQEYWSGVPLPSPKVAQSCPTLCNPMYYTVHEILQARILEWVAFSLSRGSSQPRDQTQVSHIAGWLFATLWTGACHTSPLSMEFSMQDYWSELPFYPPGGLPNPGFEPTFPVTLALAGWFLTTESAGKSSAISISEIKASFIDILEVLSLLFCFQKYFEWLELPGIFVNISPYLYLYQKLPSCRNCWIPMFIVKGDVQFLR